MQPVMGGVLIAAGTEAPVTEEEACAGVAGLDALDQRSTHALILFRLRLIHSCTQASPQRSATSSATSEASDSLQGTTPMPPPRICPLYQLLLSFFGDLQTSQTYGLGSFTNQILQLLIAETIHCEDD